MFETTIPFQLAFFALVEHGKTNCIDDENEIIKEGFFPSC